jgi:hypothetical protein
VTSPVRFEMTVSCRQGKVVIPYINDGSANYSLDYMREVSENVSLYAKDLSRSPGNYTFTFKALITDQDGDRMSDLNGGYMIKKPLTSAPINFTVGSVQGVSEETKPIFRFIPNFIKKLGLFN